MCAGTACSTCACGTRQARSLSTCGAPRRSARESASRRLDETLGPIAMNALSAPLAQLAAAAAASPENTPALCAAARSTISPPIATPPRKSSLEPLRRKTPTGRFWIGKSASGAFADSTQLSRPASCVSLISVIRAPAASGFRWVEVLREPLPAGVIAVLELRGLEREPGRSNGEPRLEHERHRVGDAVGLREVARRGLFERVRVGAVTGHAVVERRAPGDEAFRLRVVDAVDEAHEFARDVAMEPRWPEGVLHDEPAWREDHEVDHVDARGVGGRLQHEEDRRVGVIVAGRADHVEPPQV